MTSSLVGSEMCIRDRVGLGSSPRVWGYGDLDLGCSPFGLGLGPLPVFGAVSYTHLTLPTICSV
eukprot:8695696-Prorocentrum_lima.AAC.1